MLYSAVFSFFVENFCWKTQNHGACVHQKQWSPKVGLGFETLSLGLCSKNSLGGDEEVAGMWICMAKTMHQPGSFSCWFPCQNRKCLIHVNNIGKMYLRFGKPSGGKIWLTDIRNEIEASQNMKWPKTRHLQSTASPPIRFHFLSFCTALGHVAYPSDCRKTTSWRHLFQLPHSHQICAAHTWDDTAVFDPWTTFPSHTTMQHKTFGMELFATMAQVVFRQTDLPTSRAHSLNTTLTQLKSNVSEFKHGPTASTTKSDGSALLKASVANTNCWKSAINQPLFWLCKKSSPNHQKNKKHVRVSPSFFWEMHLWDLDVCNQGLYRSPRQSHCWSCKDHPKSRKDHPTTWSVHCLWLCV